MKSDIIRLYKSIHTWTGIVSGLALFIAFYAGALTIFSGPLARWSAAATPPMPVVTLDETPQLITQTLAARPAAAREFTLYLQQNELHPGRIGWRELPPDVHDHHMPGARQYFATLREDGELAVTEVTASPVAHFIDVLHRVVGLPVDEDATRWVMGVICVLYTLALVSGVILLLPTLVKDFFALRLGKNLKRMWMDAHNVVGIISLPFHLVMALTAVVFAFHDGIYALQETVVYQGKIQWSGSRGVQAPTDVAPDPGALLPPRDLLAKVRQLSPTFEPQMLQYVNVTGEHPLVRFWGHDATALSPRVGGGFVALQPYSGEVLSADFMPGRQEGAAMLVTSFFALHFGTFGGSPVSWMYFLLGLAGAWLFYSGNLLWIEARRRKQRRNDEPLPVQRRDTYWMCAATVGICLGAVSGMSLTLAASKWLHGRADDLMLAHQLIYYLVFFACIGWSLWRGGARASVDLLRWSAVAAFAIPLTTVLCGLLPGVSAGAAASFSTMGVDITALLGGLCFLWMAHATARRIRSHPADSVWYAQTSS